MASTVLAKHEKTEKVPTLELIFSRRRRAVEKLGNEQTN